MKEHKISLLTAVLLSMNILIGSGILIGPRLISDVSGNAGFLSWTLVAVLFLPLVLCIAQLSNMFPGCGGFYTYTKEGINKNVGFISGWLYVVGFTLAASVDMIALRRTFLANGIENFFTTNALIFNLLFLILLVSMNLMNLKAISRILNSLTIAKLLPLIILILLLPFIIKPTFSISAKELSLVPHSLPFAIFGYFGFEYCCSLTHLIQNGKKNAPRAILIAFIITAALYTLFHFGLLQLMGVSGLSKLGASEFAQFIDLPVPYLKSFLIVIIPIASILTIFAGANGILNANSILMNSMAQEGLFLYSPFLAKFNKNGRPWVTIVLLGLLAFSVATIISDINKVGNMCNFGVFASFIFPFISLFLIQRAKKIGIAKKILTVISILITLGFIIYSWLQIAPTNFERLVIISPLIIFFIIGYILFLLSEKR